MVRARIGGVRSAEWVKPSPDRFVGNLDAALSQDFFSRKRSEKRL
jgi:hypothetical protein